MTDIANPLVGYLGWHGRGNLGDDAIYDAVRSQLSGANFIDLPRLPHETISAVATGLNRSLRHSALVVGGGTVVGRRHWRRLVSRGLALTRNKGSYAIGVGVEDPVFVGRNGGSDKDELKRWSPILSDFHTVSVRGPRSAELLSDIGLSVRGIRRPGISPPATRPGSRRWANRSESWLRRRSLGARPSDGGRRDVARHRATFITRPSVRWDSHES